jgi:hypothetical protein
VFVVFVLAGPRGIMGIVDDVRVNGVAAILRNPFQRRAPVEPAFDEALKPLDESPAVSETGVP